LRPIPFTWGGGHRFQNWDKNVVKQHRSIRRAVRFGGENRKSSRDPIGNLMEVNAFEAA
jgi:hypothetical protein